MCIRGGIRCMNAKKTVIAVDAMGGDFAPHAAVEGAVLACREHQLQVTLVGNREAIMPHLRRLKVPKSFPLGVHHASQVVGMGDNPLEVVRKKRDSSIRVGLDLVSQCACDAFVSAGNSGAVASGSVLVLKRISDIDRPAIAAVLPTASGTVLIADAGAGSSARAFNLVQFALMASVYGSVALRCKKPRIGLLSNGQEDSKGTEEIRDAHRLLRASSLNYMGYIEGRDVFRNLADVVICDGFTGNVLLKTAEGMAESLASALQIEINKSIPARIGAFLAQKRLLNLRRRFDYAEYGGAPLLGVAAPVIICHGRSQAPAIKNAIKAAADYAGSGAVSRIEHELRPSRDLKTVGKKPSFIRRMLHDMKRD